MAFLPILLAAEGAATTQEVAAPEQLPPVSCVLMQSALHR
jgi:hypothetical protein